MKLGARDSSRASCGAMTAPLEWRAPSHEGDRERLDTVDGRHPPRGAALRPPALKAIVTLCSTDDRYADDVHYMGGAKLDAGFGWAAFFFSDMCHPPDPVLVGERWREMWLERLHALPLFLERWLRHP